MVKCKDEDLMKWLTKHHIHRYYKNNLCFNDKRYIPAWGNWFSPEFKNVYISFDYCNNSTYSDVKTGK